MSNRYKVLAVLAFALGTYSGALTTIQSVNTQPRALIPCDTDTDCMQKNGGDGGPQLCHVNTDCDGWDAQ